MKLSKRLQAIYDMIPSGVAADVGSDHGKLIISLFEGGVISKGAKIISFQCCLMASANYQVMLISLF